VWWFYLSVPLHSTGDHGHYIVYAVLIAGTATGIAIAGILARRIGVLGVLVIGMLMTVAAPSLLVVSTGQLGVSLAAFGTGLGAGSMAKPLLLAFCVPSIPPARLATATCAGWMAAMGLTWLFNNAERATYELEFHFDPLAAFLMVCAAGFAIAVFAGWTTQSRRSVTPSAINTPPTPWPALWRPAVLLVIVWFALAPDMALREIAAEIGAAPLASAITGGVALACAACIGVLVDRYGSRRGLRFTVGAAVLLFVVDLLLPPDPAPSIMLVLQLTGEITRLVSMPIAFVYLIHQFPELDICRFGLIAAAVTLVSSLLANGMPLLKLETLTTWLSIAALALGWLVLMPKNQHARWSGSAPAS
jgi:hypothetical protein